MMGPDDLRAWCMQQPRPHVVHVTTIDGSAHEVLCQGPWTKVGETIAALQPDMLQARSADGKVLRAIRPADYSSDWNDEQPTQSDSRVPKLEGIPITAADPETQRFALVAQLIAEAYKHSNTVAFNQLVGIVESMNARVESVERAREQFHRAQIKQLEDQIRALGQEPEAGGGPSDILGAMMAQFMGGMGAAQHAAPAPAPSSNGKGKHS